MGLKNEQLIEVKTLLSFYDIPNELNDEAVRSYTPVLTVLENILRFDCSLYDDALFDQSFLDADKGGYHVSILLHKKQNPTSVIYNEHYSPFYYEYQFVKDRRIKLITCSSSEFIYTLFKEFGVL